MSFISTTAKLVTATVDLYLQKMVKANDANNTFQYE